MSLVDHIDCVVLCFLSFCVGLSSVWWPWLPEFPHPLLNQLTKSTQQAAAEYNPQGLIHQHMARSISEPSNRSTVDVLFFSSFY